jgi:hypothetical protein
MAMIQSEIGSDAQKKNPPNIAPGNVAPEPL